MEKLGETLERSRPDIPAPKITEGSEEDQHEVLKRVLNVTSLENTFDRFRKVKGAEKALAAFKELANGAAWHMLLCYGSAGCGKTHLCEALVIHFSDQRPKARLWEWPELIRNFKKRMRANDGTYDEFFESVRRMPRLIIDDVGLGGADSAWAWGEFEDIINYRYRNNLLTVVTTNLDLAQLPDRAVSRFRDGEKGRIVLNEAPDYRPSKGKK